MGTANSCIRIVDDIVLDLESTQVAARSKHRRAGAQPLRRREEVRAARRRDRRQRLSAPKFHPFWAKAEQLGVLVFIHPQGSSSQPADWCSPTHTSS